MLKHGAESLTMTTSEGLPGDLTPKQKGEVLRNRRIAAGIRTPNRLATLSPFDRGTIKKAEEGTASQDTMDSLAAWLDNYADENLAPPTDQVVTFQAKGVFGVAEISVAGPVENTDELAEKFATLIAKIARDAGGSAP